MFSEEFILKGYAGLLGKVIGVRLGSPVEGWSYERIAAEHGDVDGYLAEYTNYASDDDLNGPLFFFRALLDYGLDADAESVGKAVLNYVPFEHSFFWWGGYGVSSEHTSYTNLRAGIPAPRSGSVEMNGPVIAEQIGGQIFSDCWGFVCPGDPAKAASYASRASSVLHGGEGVYGGMFVAACIAAAYTAKSVDEIMDAGLAQIPSGCLYAKVVRDIRAFHAGSPADWRKCFRYVFENWGYDRYPGNCHIIPNTAVMILALCYGGGEYGKTIRICNMCGWDTDCNVGNVGSIMGAFVGLGGIEKIWREPMCDFLAASSVVGYLNIIDIANASLVYSKVACEIAGEALPEKYAKYVDAANPVCHFELPGSLHGFRVEGGFDGALVNTNECSYSGERCLNLRGIATGAAVDAAGGAAGGSADGASDGARANGASGGVGTGAEAGAADGASEMPRPTGCEGIYLYIKTYYVPADFSDSRYDPSFSPTVYPGACCSVFARSGAGPITTHMAAFGRDEGELCAGAAVQLDGEWRELKLDTSAAPKDATIFGVGLVLDAAAEGQKIDVYIDDFRISKDADYTIDFSKEQTEIWNGRHRDVPQLVRLGGIWELLGGALWASGARHCRAYTGHYYWSDYTVSATIAPQGRFASQVGDAFRLLGRAQGAERSYAATLAGGMFSIEKQDGEFTPLASAPFAFAVGDVVNITLAFDGNRITASANGTELSVTDEKCGNGHMYGCVGWSVEKGRMRIDKTSVKTK